MNSQLNLCGFIPGTNVTYVYVPTPMTWSQAQSYCRENHTDLASVRNMAEQKKTEEFVPNGQFAWIGLSKEPPKWSDGSQVSFGNWKGHAYSGANPCAAADFSDSGQWRIFNCETKRASICYSGEFSSIVDLQAFGLLAV